MIGMQFSQACLEMPESRWISEQSVTDIAKPLLSMSQIHEYTTTHGHITDLTFWRMKKKLKEHVAYNKLLNAWTIKRCTRFYRQYYIFCIVKNKLYELSFGKKLYNFLFFAYYVNGITSYLLAKNYTSYLHII